AAPGPPAATNGRKLEAWIEAAAEWLGMESEFAAVPYETLSRRLSEAAPALVRVPGPGEPRFVVIVKGNRRSIWLLSAKSDVERHRADEIADFLTASGSGGLKPALERLLSPIDLPPARKNRIWRAVLNEQLRAEDFEGVWLLRPAPSA